ncbi:competence CoiA-like predicted nuclease [Cytobacillus eiseniae]|uniref:Competence CoiA-like predicted nuclease n=1 Tax=Cytobacillus eiseniae TaxID=762947 RepID=A0ABS4RE52_9BACI|nr:competence protein CoiA family protein [Cytobacillus eiseniae]MBP2241180.1 competence CoiA-like predicted nuclease [Cytobacillus eiseniae]
MLVSKTTHGEILSLAKMYDREFLEKLRRKESFYCPECGEQVILKIGTKKITHFAHKKGSVCTESYERESEYHLKGKIRLYEWLKLQGVSPILEPYFKEIAQRPDISFQYRNRQYAIEYQCSVIPEELFIKRSNNYIQAGIVPIWLMAGKSIQRKGNHKASLSSFDFLFLSKSARQKWTILAFCPIGNTLITMHDILPLTIRNILTQFSIINLKEATLSNLLDPHGSNRLNIVAWRDEIRKAKNIQPLFQSPQNKFLLELYKHSLIPSLLPVEIGIPVLHAPYIETPIIQWQSYLFIDVFNKMNQFSMRHIHLSFNKRVKNRDIKLRKLPLESDSNVYDALSDYIQLLVHVEFLERIGKGQYKLTKTRSFAENQLQQDRLEENFYRKYGNRIIDCLYDKQ